MYPYEGMFLIDPVAHAASPETVEKAVQGLLEKHGAKIHRLERWDERKLAYTIKGHKRGVYLLAYFDLPGENVSPLRQECRITEVILRQLLLRLEEEVPAYLEQLAKYYDKIKEDAELRRNDRDRSSRRDREEGDEGGHALGDVSYGGDGLDREEDRDR
ncbi:MAG: 30S ribosomal protein S6 [Planctomycetaceae bacterium]